MPPGTRRSIAERLEQLSAASSAESVHCSLKVDVQSALIDDFIERQEQRVVKYLRRLKHLALELYILISLCKGRRRAANIAQCSMSTVAATIGPGLIVGGIALPPLAIAGFVTTLVASVGASLTRFGVFLANRRLRRGDVQAWKEKYEIARMDFLEEFAEYVRFAQRVVQVRSFVHEQIHEKKAPLLRKETSCKLNEAEVLTGAVGVCTLGVKTACTTFQVMSTGPAFVDASKALLSIPHGASTVASSSAYAASVVSSVSVATASVTAVGAFIDAAAAVSIGIDIYNGNKSQLATQLEQCQQALIHQIDDFAACFLEVGKSLHPILNAHFQEVSAGYEEVGLLGGYSRSRTTTLMAKINESGYETNCSPNPREEAKTSVISMAAFFHI